MKKLTLAFACGLAALSLPGASRASDHLDGVKTSIDHAADITDVFAFTSPSDANKLVVVLNVSSLSFAHTRFSDVVDYKIRIRPIEDPATMKPSADPKKERGLTCRFSGGIALVEPRQHATCTFNFVDGTETVAFETRSSAFRAGGSGEVNGTKVFAGVRSDPWFLDLGKVITFNKGLRAPDGPGANGLHGQNVLSIVAEVDKRRLPGPLLAVTGQTVHK
jgi:Domain of unknown function (DUF4331)